MMDDNKSTLIFLIILIAAIFTFNVINLCYKSRMADKGYVQNHVKVGMRVYKEWRLAVPVNTDIDTDIDKD